MRRKDVVVVITIAVFTALISFIISNIVFGTPKKKPVKVPVVQKIDPTFPDTSASDQYKAFFNNKAINPTQLIKIGDTKNTTPFRDGQ